MKRSVAVLLVVGCLLLAGCSGGGPAVPDSDTTAATTATEPATTTTVGSTDTTTASVNGTLEVHFINVDQSVATLFIGPDGETMLVDSGDFQDDGEFVLAYLRAHNIDRIDHFVTSHNDADHIGGHAAIINYYETEANGIGAIYDPGIAASTQTYEAYLDAVERHDVQLFKTVEGDEVPFTGATVDVLGPPQPYLENSARNENSIVLKITFGQTSMLMTGDAEDDQEEYLTNQYGGQLRADVLKAGHHGSKSSTSGQLLDAVQPSAVIISSAYDSRYGHPHEAVLQRLADRSITTYWTAVHGDIVLVSNGRTISVRTQVGATTEPLSLRDAEAVAPSTDSPVSERARITGRGIDPVDGATAATSTATTATDGGPQIAITEINADAAGDDQENLNDEYIVVTNQGDQSIELSGWSITDAAGHSYTIPDGTTLAPGTSVTIHTGSGTDTATDLYWGRSQPVWNNGGDTITVRSADGTVVTKQTY